MQNITIGRYNQVPDDVARPADGPEFAQDRWAGWIEGQRDDGTTWILWLNHEGSPEVYWPAREPSGAVIGDPVKLT